MTGEIPELGVRGSFAFERPGPGSWQPRRLSLSGKHSHTPLPLTDLRGETLKGVPMSGPVSSGR